MSTSAGTRSSTNASKAPRVAADWTVRAAAEQAVSQAQTRLASAQEARTRAETAVSRAQKNERGAMDAAGRDLAQAGRRGNEQQLQRAIQNERSAQDALAAVQRAASGVRSAPKQQAVPRASARAAAPKSPQAQYKSVRNAALANRPPMMRNVLGNPRRETRESYSERAARLRPALFQRALGEANRTEKLNAQRPVARAGVDAARTRYDQASAREQAARQALSTTIRSGSATRAALDRANNAYNRATAARDKARTAYTKAQEAIGKLMASLEGQGRRAAVYSRNWL
jgi:chromosome segregation protein